MKRLLTIFFIICFFAFIPIAKSTNAVLPSVKENMEKKLMEKNQPNKEIGERELIAEEVFPFLPDNHRDSGTGKFMSFE